MVPSDNRQHDPMEHELEASFAPRRFISYGEARVFVEGLESLKDRVVALVSVDPARAVWLFESMLAGCYAKAEQIDDSSASFGEFVQILYCDWVRAQQAAGADARETIKRLLTRIDGDPYGFTSRIERPLADALDPDGLAALTHAFEARLDVTHETGGSDAGPDGRVAAYARQRASEFLRAVHIRTNDVAAYVALCERTEFSADDCLAIATMRSAREAYDDALGWIDRGIALIRAKSNGGYGEYEFANRKRSLLVKLGRAAEATALAWAEYGAHPDTTSYDVLMAFAPASERGEWHGRAMEATGRTTLYSAIPLWIATGEIGRLVNRMRTMTDLELERESHSVIEPAAKALEEAHPDVAAKIYRALGVRILSAKKSKYYDEALLHFDAARRCYLRAGLDDVWQLLVADVRRDHYRKSVITGFERIVAGESPRERRTFLDEARDRWLGQPEA